MVNNSTIINKIIIYLSPQLIKQKKDYDIKKCMTLEIQVLGCY